MAEKEEKKGVLASKIFAIKNFLKRIAREGFGLPFHYTPTPGFEIKEIPTFKLLDQLIDFKTIKTLNNLMVETEAKWEGSSGVDIENISHFRKEIIELYTKDEKGEINESIGPFTDRSALLAEGNAAEFGTGIKEEYIIINKNGQKIRSIFSIPKHKPIIYDDGRADNETGVAYEVAFFGTSNKAYWEKLKQEVRQICDKVKQVALGSEADPAKKENITTNINRILAEVESMIEAVRIYTINFEDEHRKKLKGGNSVDSNWNILEKLKSEIMLLKLTDEQVHYTHTYKVIKPIIRDEQGNLIKRLKQVMPDFKRPEEVDYGLDEYGWPLEVGDGHTKFEGGVLKEGIVLIDLYMNDLIEMKIKRLNNQLNKEKDVEKRRQLKEEINELGGKRHEVRKVPEEFIVDCDLLDTITWMFVHYDSYRDDLRDGRYHQDAISVMERIMTELKMRGHPQSMKDIKNRNHAEPIIKLNSLPGNPRRLPTDPDSVKMTIKPSHLIPAFDLNAKSKTKHIGRIYYYETQNESVQSPEPTITTRGAALYILHRVIEEVKYWGGTGDPSKAGIVELMEAIGGMTDGFDIGPNMGPPPDYPRWGKSLSKNPFKPVQ